MNLCCSSIFLKLCHCICEKQNSLQPRLGTHYVRGSESLRGPPSQKRGQLAEVSQQVGIAGLYILKVRKYQTTRNLNNSIKFNNDTSSSHYWIPTRFLLLCLGDHSVPRLEDNFERKVSICFLLQQDSASNIKVYVLLHKISPFTH